MQAVPEELDIVEPRGPFQAAGRLERLLANQFQNHPLSQIF